MGTQWGYDPHEQACANGARPLMCMLFLVDLLVSAYQQPIILPIIAYHFSSQAKVSGFVLPFPGKKGHNWLIN